MGAPHKGNDIIVETLANELDGQVNQLSPEDRARLGLAFWVLGAVFALVLLSGILLIYGPDCRKEQTQAFFDFMKTLGPPLVTLVIGFYFRSSKE